MTDCNRCGQCCCMVDEKGEPTEKDCRFLIRFKSRITVCRIYRQKNRIGKKLDKFTVCHLRKNTKYDFKGCPQNSGKKIWEFKKR